MKKIIFQITCIFGIFLLLVLIVIDYLNIPSMLGLRILNIHIDLFGVVLNAVVVISLYVITFSVIDRRQLDKDDNARQTANILILSAYKQCKEKLGLVNDTIILENYIMPKIDLNKSDLDNSIMMNLKNSPFAEHEKIIDYAATGAVDAISLSKYYKLMELYKTYVSIRITFFDIYKYTGSKHKQLQNKIINEKNNIELLLNTEITRLEKEIGTGASICGNRNKGSDPGNTGNTENRCQSPRTK